MDEESENRIYLKTGDLIVLQSEIDDGFFSISLEEYKAGITPSKSQGNFPLWYVMLLSNTVN